MSGTMPRVSGGSPQPVPPVVPPEGAAPAGQPLQAGGLALDSRASNVPESAASMAQRRTDIRSFTAMGTRPAVTELHRQTVRERVPQLGPVGVELAASALAMFEQRGGTALPAQGRGATAKQFNRLAGEVVYEALRSHYKDGLKSSNWRYAQDGQAPADKRQRREDHALRSGELLQQLDDRGAPLEAYLALKIGNCQVHAAAATALARALGAKANIWHFVDAEDREDDEGDLIAAHTHAVCIVGEVPSLQDPQRPAGKYERTGDVQADHLFAVDTWSGLKGPGSSFRDDFRQKMIDKSLSGKLIAIEVEGDDPAHPEEVREQLVSPRGEAWLGMTADSPFSMRKDIEPDPKYRPE